jgi:hypothetical protein
MSKFRHNRFRPNRRRGVTIIFVLALIAVTMALSYSLLRTQVTAMQIQANSNQRTLSRQAAMTGLSAALRQMQLQAWIDDGGVGSTLSGQINVDESYFVTFSTGDPMLTPSHPDYEDFPYRVTVLSTGYAVDPANADTIASHQVQAVVQLVPKQLSSQPSSWADIQNYSLFQFKPTANGGILNLEIETLCQVEGRVRVQGPIKLLPEAPIDGSAQARLLSDMDEMRQAGLGDYRPFTGPLDVDTSQSDSGTISQLTDSLSITVNDVAKSTTAGITRTGEIASYQIYSGGPTYSVPRISRDQANVVLGPDPIGNPLGMYLRTGHLNCYNNVTIRGTMILSSATNDLHVRGQGVRFESVDLPPLEGSDAPIRLPTAIVAKDFEIHINSECTADGMLVVWDHFHLQRDSQTGAEFRLQGKLLAQEVKLDSRFEWDKPSGWWGKRLSEFLEFFGNLPNGSTDPERFFPVWLQQNHGLQLAPRMTIKPGSTPVSYHWYNPDQPIYVPHPDDSGLRWDLVSWKDSP